MESTVNDFRKDLQKCAKQTRNLNFEQKNKDDEMKGFQEFLATSVMTMMEFDTAATELCSIYKKLDETIAQKDNLTMDDVKDLWEKERSEVGEITETAEEFYKELVKEITEQNDDMEVMQVQFSRKDPISKKNIEKPVKANKCPHVFDLDSVKAFAGKKREIQCPYQGCREKVSISKLVDYPEFFNNVADD